MRVSTAISCAYFGGLVRSINTRGACTGVRQISSRIFRKVCCPIELIDDPHLFRRLTADCVPFSERTLASTENRPEVRNTHIRVRHEGDGGKPSGRQSTAKSRCSAQQPGHQRNSSWPGSRRSGRLPNEAEIPGAWHAEETEVIQARGYPEGDRVHLRSSDDSGGNERSSRIHRSENDTEATVATVVECPDDRSNDDDNIVNIHDHRNGRGTVTCIGERAPVRFRSLRASCPRGLTAWPPCFDVAGLFESSSGSWIENSAHCGSVSPEERCYNHVLCSSSTV